MHWIEVSERVPHDRREVLTWGTWRWSLPGMPDPTPQFLGVSRFNMTASGGEFDNERHGGNIWLHRITVVTHWAEIEGPEGCQ